MKNRKLQILRKKEVHQKLFPPTSLPEKVSVPIQPEHESKSQEDKPKSKKCEYIPIVITHAQSPSVMYFKLKHETANHEDKLTK